MPTKTATLRPTADAGINRWNPTPNDGQPHSFKVDEDVSGHDGDTTHLETNASTPGPDQQERFVMGPIPSDLKRSTSVTLKAINAALTPSDQITYLMLVNGAQKANVAAFTDGAGSYKLTTGAPADWQTAIQSKNDEVVILASAFSFAGNFMKLTALQLDIEYEAAVGFVELAPASGSWTASAGGSGSWFTITPQGGTWTREE